MRLIDADALLQTLSDLCCADNNVKTRKIIDLTLHDLMPQIISDEPTVDAHPVTHGEWIPSKMNAENKENAGMLGIDIEAFLSKAAYCSCCGIQQITNGRDRTGKALIHKAVYKYCPNCGAKMHERAMQITLWSDKDE